MSAVQSFGLRVAASVELHKSAPRVILLLPICSIQNTTNPSSFTEIEGAEGAEEPHHDVGNEEEDYDSIDSDDGQNEDENDDTADVVRIFGQQGSSNGNGGAVMRNAAGRFVAKHQTVDMAAVFKQPSKLAEALEKTS
ncbi:hypothetical protein HDU90_005199 [Geranomyces variabilis]|nr:hypothetical protein HDU90_005199 [Geranomyces variabilis]